MAAENEFGSGDGYLLRVMLPRLDRIIWWVTPADAWNLADDVARSLGMSWGQHGRIEDGCYSKLFGASVPWAVGEESYSPRWPPYQEKRLRTQLSHAIALLIRALGPGSDRS